MFSAGTAAMAHEAYTYTQPETHGASVGKKGSGWSYDAWCCSNRDCEPISQTAVTETAEGYRVVLEPGDHSMVRERLEKFFPHSAAKKSGDWSPHACVIPQSQEFRCFYAAPGAF
jgi:hypothetical protein